MKEFLKLFSLLAFLFSCENTQQNINQFVEGGELPVEVLTDSEIQYTENGLLKVRVTSKNMQRFIEDEDRIELSGGVHVDFYKLNQNSQKSKLFSENAIINNSKNLMIAINNVELKSTDNKILKTEELVWDKNQNLVYTDKNVQIQTDDEIISGKGFKSTPDFKEYEISQVTGTFYIDK